MFSLRLAMMDLVIVMTPFVDEASLTKTFELIRPYLEVRKKKKKIWIQIFLGDAISVFRPRNRACKRRRTAYWRRCAAGSEKSVGHLCFQIWKR